MSDQQTEEKEVEILTYRRLDHGKLLHRLRRHLLASSSIGFCHRELFKSGKSKESPPNTLQSKQPNRP